MIFDLSQYFKKRDNWLSLGLVGTLFLSSIFFTILSPYFFSLNNFLNILSAMSIKGIIALGLTVVVIAGGIDLSVSSTAAVSGLVCAKLLHDGVNGSAAFGLALLVALILGSINAMLIVGIRITPINATLGTLLLFRGIAAVTTSAQNIIVGANAWATLGRGEMLGVQNIVWMFLLIGVCLHLYMKYSVVGRQIYAIGDNSEACRTVGIKVGRIRTGCYVMQALLAGLAGISIVSQTGSATPLAFSGAELDIITAVLLGGASLGGGRGRISGTALGLLVLGVLGNGMILMGLQVYWQAVMRGIFLLIAVSLDSFRTGGGYK